MFFKKPECESCESHFSLQFSERGLITWRTTYTYGLTKHIQCFIDWLVKPEKKVFYITFEK